MAADFLAILPSERRRALRLGLWQGAIWAIGNALTTGSLISYLARDLGAQGLALSLVLAAPNLGGVLRLCAPALLDRAGTARRACLQISLASYLLLAALPLLAASMPQRLHGPVVVAMIGLLFAHQMLEYLGLVALWDWWADLVPQRIRGRYFGRRQMWQLAVTVPTLLASGYFADQWREKYRDQPEQLVWAYCLPIAVGVLFLLGSLLPLMRMPATRRYARDRANVLAAEVARPFVDRAFWSVLVFRAWFSLANGISQTVQNVIYPKDVLGLGVAPMAGMRVTTQIGQLAAAPWVGRWSDRWGNRPLLIVAQALVSSSLLFYLAATGPPTRWLLWGAWVLFAAYVVHNICLPNLVLKFAPAGSAAAYVASHDVVGSIFHAVATIAGGALFDLLRAHSPDATSEPYRSCVIVLVAGLTMRSVGVVLLRFIHEPGAWTWRQILRRQGPPASGSGDSLAMPSRSSVRA